MKLKNNIVLASLAVIALLAPSSAFAALTIGSTSVTSDAGLTLSGAVGSAIALGSTATTGTLTIGGTTQTGAITVGNSTGSQSVYIAGGTQASGSRNVYIGNNAAAGSSTIYIGSDISGTQSTINIGNNNSGRSVNQLINIGRADLADGKTNEICIACVANFGTNYTDIVIGNWDANASVNIRGGDSININGNTTADINIGHGSGAGTILLGFSTASNTISVGSGNTATGNTQTINIGAGTPAGTGKATVTVGNTNGASGIVLRAGTAGIDANSSAYLRIPSGTTDPAAGDCNEAGEAGKIYIDTDAGSGTLYICSG
jgi:hypothetical protein